MALHSFLWLNNILLTTIYSSIHQVIDIWDISTFWPLWIVLLWLFVYKCLSHCFWFFGSFILWSIYSVLVAKLSVLYIGILWILRTLLCSSHWLIECAAIFSEASNRVLEKLWARICLKLPVLWVEDNPLLTKKPSWRETNYTLVRRYYLFRWPFPVSNLNEALMPGCKYLSVCAYMNVSLSGQ